MQGWKRATCLVVLRGRGAWGGQASEGSQVLVASVEDQDDDPLAPSAQACNIRFSRHDNYNCPQANLLRLENIPPTSGPVRLRPPSFPNLSAHASARRCTRSTWLKLRLWPMPLLCRQQQVWGWNKRALPFLHCPKYPLQHAAQSWRWRTHWLE